MYRARLIEPHLRDIASAFPIVLVTGARQVGKTTLVQHVFGERAPLLVFDPVLDLHGAMADPEFFLDQHRPPIILDEIQYAPGLLPGIKRRVDRERQPGQYILTGSQSLSLLRHVSESLAGRVAVVDLEPMTDAETHGRAHERTWLGAWLDDPDGFRPPGAWTPPGGLFRKLWRGGFPGMLDLPDRLHTTFFESYVRTYVERDLRIAGNVQDTALFGRFLALCAALTAQEVNFGQLGRELGVTPQTASRWLALLRATFLWVEVPPYSGNAIKRLSQRPKGYLGDPGLAAYLQVLRSPEALSVSRLLGPLFETAAVHEVRRTAAALERPPAFYHWRTHGGAEVDLVLERDGKLYPIEVKLGGRPTRRDEAGLRAFRETYPDGRVQRGLILAPVSEAYAVSPETLVLPWDA